MEGNAMSVEQPLNNEMMLEDCFVPGLETAIKAWYAARHRFQIEPVRQSQDAYNKSTFELGQAFSEWSTQQPELFEQVRFWFYSHEKD